MSGGFSTNLLQSPLEEVSGCVVFLYRVPVSAYGCLYIVPDTKRSFGQAAPVNNTVGYLYSIFDDETALVGFYGAAITYLTARLSIETSPVKNNTDFGVNLDMSLVFETVAINECDYFTIA